jgi:hypothetical protein
MIKLYLLMRLHRFRPGPLIQTLMYHLDVSDVGLIIGGTGGIDSNRRRREITRFLKGVRVTFTHLQRRSPTKSINELDWRSARDYMFYNDKAQAEMSVEVRSLSRYNGSVLTDFCIRNTLILWDIRFAIQDLES